MDLYKKQFNHGMITTTTVSPILTDRLVWTLVARLCLLGDKLLRFSYLQHTTHGAL